MLVMKKQGSKLPDRYKEIAINNGLSIATVYARLQRGWDLDSSVNTPPKSSPITKLPRDDEGNLLPSDRPKTHRSFSFNIYKDLENDFNKAVLESGKSKSDFVSDAIEFYLKYGKRQQQQQ